MDKELKETLLETAIDLATRAHKGQMDEDGLPHIVHALAVMFAAKTLYEEKPLTEYTLEEIMIAAVLHDTVEDTWVQFDLIGGYFGPKVRELVEALSRKNIKDEKNKEFYRDFIYRAKANPGARLIKIADVGHNFGRSHKIKKASWRKKLQYKYQIALSVLNDSDEPTWEEASWQMRTDDKNVKRYYVADPNGKEKEITLAELEEIKKAVAAAK